MKKIITILTFAIIAFISPNLKAQSIVGPTTVKAGEMNYFYYVGNGVLGDPSNSFASDAFWYQTSPYTAPEDYNYYSDNDYNN